MTDEKEQKNSWNFPNKRENISISLYRCTTSPQFELYRLGSQFPRRYKKNSGAKIDVTVLRIKTTASSSRRPHKLESAQHTGTFFNPSRRSSFFATTFLTDLSVPFRGSKQSRFDGPSIFFLPFHENRSPADLIVCNFSPFHLAHSSLQPPFTIGTGTPAVLR
jgi:hypothetical protein